MNNFTSAEIMEILKDRKMELKKLLEIFDIIEDTEQIGIIKGRLKEIEDLMWILEVKCI